MFPDYKLQWVISLHSMHRHVWLGIALLNRAEMLLYKQQTKKITSSTINYWSVSHGHSDHIADNKYLVPYALLCIEITVICSQLKYIHASLESNLSFCELCCLLGSTFEQTVLHWKCPYRRQAKERCYKQQCSKKKTVLIRNWAVAIGDWTNISHTTMVPLYSRKAQNTVKGLDKSITGFHGSNTLSMRSQI